MVCVGTQCVSSVAARVVAKRSTDPFFYIGSSSEGLKKTDTKQVSEKSIVLGR